MLFVVDLGHRLATVSVANRGLARDLHDVLHDYLVDGAGASDIAQLEFALVPELEDDAVPTSSGQDRVGTGIHHLYGPDSLVYHRTTDLGDLVRSLLDHLGNEIAVAENLDDIWIRGTVLELDDGSTTPPAVVSAPRLFSHWKSTRRRIEKAGFSVCDGHNVRIAPDGSHIDVPVVDIPDFGLSEALSDKFPATMRQRRASQRRWTDIRGIVSENQGGSDIDDPRAESAFELVHQAFLLRLMVETTALRAASEEDEPAESALERASATVDALIGLARRVDDHASCRLDSDFCPALQRIGNG